MDQQPTTDLEALRDLGTLLDGGYSVSDKRGIVTQAAAEIDRLRVDPLLRHLAHGWKHRARGGPHQ